MRWPSLHARRTRRQTVRKDPSVLVNNLGTSYRVLDLRFVLAASLPLSYAVLQAGFWVIVGGLTVITATIFLFSSPRTLV